jgi:hypothetical protein
MKSVKEFMRFRNITKSKGIPRQAEVALGILGRLRPQIFSTFSTTRLAGRQPNAPAAFTPGENPGTHFQRLSQPQGTWFCRKEPLKKFQVTPLGINPGTVLLVAQRRKITGLSFFSEGLPVYLTFCPCVATCNKLYNVMQVFHSLLLTISVRYRGYIQQ